MAEAELTTIARPYAKAAFGYAVDQDGGLNTWSRMLALLAATVEAQVVRDRLDDPLATSEQGASFIIELLDDELETHARNFVRILAEYDRIDLLPNIAELFELLKANHEKTVNVEVTSAFDVTDTEAESLSETLHDYLKRDIKLTTSTDKSLLGGVVIRAEDNVIDNSVKGKLRKLSQALS